MNWKLENQKLVNSYLNRLAVIYEKTVKQAISIGYSVTNYSTEKPFLFSDYPGVNKKADKLFSQTAYEIESMINGATQQAWMLGNVMSDGVVDNYFKNSGIPAEKLAKYYNRNLEALVAFQQRVEDGVNLSDRIWKYTGQFKNEIELAIGIGIGEGQSASALSRDIREYLNEPKKLFHKVRNAHGELVLSKNAKAYHPGQGVYRSSYKNAMRVTRSEINMSFHQSDNTRWNSLDFVSGFHVSLSNGHPQEDICDILQGDYPKEFSFWGWHTQCMCHTTPILSPQNEFIGQMVEELKTGDTSGYIPSNKIEGLPENFKAWAAQNQDRIENAKSMPYFIDKNFKGTNVQKWFKQADKWAENSKKSASESAIKSSELKSSKVDPEIAAKEAKKQAFYDASYSLAQKKLAEAETLGLNTPGGAFEKLKSVLQNESSTYSQIDGAITKLNAEIKYIKSGEAAKAAEEAAAAAIKAEQEAAALAEKLAAEAKKAGFMEYEIKYANKKLLIAENMGISGVNVDALKAILEDKNATYSQIANKSNKLAKEIKSAKELITKAPSDQYSEASLLKKFSKQEVDNLFSAYNNFYSNKLDGLDITAKINKIEFEINWLKSNGKYSTSKVFGEMLERDLEALKAEYKAIVDKHEAENGLIDKPIKLPKLTKKEIDRLIADYNTNTVEEVDARLRKLTENSWSELSAEERNVLTKYTQTYSYLNEPLRGIPYYGELKPNLEHISDLPKLTKSLSLCTTVENMVVRRGTSNFMIKELGYGLDSLKEGDIFVDKGFLSTAVHRTKGFKYDFDLVIVTPKGAQGAYAETFSHYTDSGKFTYGSKSNLAHLWDGKSVEPIGGEQEWIGQRGSQFKVLKREGKKIYLQMIGQLQ